MNLHEETTLPARFGSWTVVRVLGRGGMASVFEVRGARGERRALKLLHDARPASVVAPPPEDELERRFRREFRTLSRLNHPNIARVYEWGQEQGRVWFVMELVEGVDLGAAVDAWGDDPARFERARGILLQVCRALEYIHLRGFVHRDVTPGNILVVADGSVRLMDFGVVKGSDGAEATQHGGVVGTLAYVAPEQILGGAVDARTDLYSLGAVLYRMLTGRRPFNARTAAGYLEKHLHAEPRPPRELVPDVPPALEEVCLRLLKKDPAARYASASHLRHVLEGGSPRNEPGDWPPEVVGRAAEVAALVNEVGACLEGQGGVTFITGAGGLGKTRLLRVARDHARRLGIPVFKMRSQAGQGPLQALRPLVMALAAERPPLPTILDRFYARNDDVPMERYEVYAGFRDLLAGRGPRVLLVDDLHVADPVSIELLEYLVRSLVALGREPVRFILAGTSGVQDLRLEGLQYGGPLELVPTLLVLRPLAEAAVEELVLSVLPDDPASRALARRLHQDGEGSPAALVEMLQGLRAEGVLEGEPPALRLVVSEADVLKRALPIPRSIREAFSARMGRLPPDARTIVELLAVAGQELPLELVCGLVELGEDRLTGLLDALVDHGVVRERAGELEELYELAHPREAELARAELSPATRAELHRRVGQALERYGRRQLHLHVEALARHFEAAQLPGKAFPYLLRAGQRLQGRSFVAQANELYGRALALSDAVRSLLPLEEVDRELCLAHLLRAGTWDVLGHPGHRAADVREAEALARELGDPGLLSRALAQAGSIARVADDLPRAESLLHEALRQADLAGDPSLRVLPLQALAGVRWAQRDLDGARKGWAELVQLGESSRDERAQAYGANGLGLYALCRGDASDARRSFERACELFERLGVLRALSSARVNLVEIHHLAGSFRRGMELADRTISHARETRHRLGLSRGRCFRSLLLVDLGRTAEAFADAEEAVAIARELEDHEEEVACLVSAIRAALAMADRARALPLLDQVERLLARHDGEGFLPVVLGWRARLEAEAGETIAARALLQRALEAPGARWAYQECRLDLTVARALEALGDRAGAYARAQAVVRRADAGGFRFYALKGHCLAAAAAEDDAALARHRRVADALVRSLAANLAREEADRFLGQAWIQAVVSR